MPQPNHILVIRLSALGDIAMMVPVLRVVLKTYPDLTITVLSRKHVKPLFDELPQIRFLEADVDGKHKGFGILKLAREIRKLNVDAVADLHNVIRSKILRIYCRLYKIRTATIDKGRAEKKALTKGITLRPLKSTHQRYADVFAGLGFPIQLKDHQFPKRKDRSQRINTFIGSTNKKAIGIAPFAAYRSKMYPLEHMTAVVQKLSETDRFVIFLFGAGSEEIKTMQNMAAGLATVKVVAGAFLFDEELELISNLDLMLSMDSSNGHLAAMYGIPVVTLWGVTHPYLGFQPFQQPDENQLLSDRKTFPQIPTSVYGNKYPGNYEKVMETIAPEEVVEKILSLL